MPKTYIYRLFYAREHVIKASSLAEIKDRIEARRLTAKGESYGQLWEMSNETDGEMIGFFENDTTASIIVPINKAKLTKQLFP